MKLFCCFIHFYFSWIRQSVEKIQLFVIVRKVINVSSIFGDNENSEVFYQSLQLERLCSDDIEPRHFFWKYFLHFYRERPRRRMVPIPFFQCIAAILSLRLNCWLNALSIGWSGAVMTLWSNNCNKIISYMAFINWRLKNHYSLR